jgi:hypothetical protein
LGEKFVRILDAISEAAPEVGKCRLGKSPYRGDYLTMDEARGKITRWVEGNPATIDDVPDPEYGHLLIAMNEAGRSPKNVIVSANVGGRFGDSVDFDVGSVGIPSDLETVTYPLFRAALQAIIAQFPPVWAKARLYIPSGSNETVPVDDPPLLARRARPGNISLAPGIPPHPNSSYHRPWLSYLCAPLTKGLIPPVGVPCERTADGGLLMIAAEERLDPTNPDHMRRSRAMAEVMIARAGNPPRPGWWPVDEAWPSTPEGRQRQALKAP